MKNAGNTLIIRLASIVLISLFMGIAIADGDGECANIGDFVWYDLNIDGIQDIGEPGMPGVTVKLYREDDTYVDSTITNASGYYEFATYPGMYYVRFILPDCSIFSPKDQGSDDTIDSDANPIDGKTEVTTLSIDENDVTWDAGMFQCMDTVYVDDNYTTSTPGFNIDHFPTLQVALDRLCVNGTAIVFDGIYDEDPVHKLNPL